MKKYMNRIICFAVALSILATSSFIDFKTTYGITPISSEFEETETGENNDEAKTTVLADLFGVTGLDKNVFSSKSSLLGTSRAFAEGEDAITYTVTGFTNDEGIYPTAGSTSLFLQNEKTICLAQLQNGTSTPFPATSAVTFISSNSGVVEIVDTNAQPFATPADNTPDNPTDPTCKLVRRGPGTATISALFTADGQVISFQFDVQVKFAINKVEPEWLDPTGGLLGDASKILVLDMADYLDDPADDFGDPFAEGYAGHRLFPLTIKYIGDTGHNTSANVQAIQVKEGGSYNESVVKYRNGKLLVVGAGLTHVTLTTETDGQTAEFDVLVKPRGSFNAEPSAYWLDASGHPMLLDNVNASTTDNSFTLYTNAERAALLNWTVARYDESYTSAENDHYRELKDDTYLTYSVSQNSGVVNFQFVQAGTYKVTAKCKDSYTAGYNILTYYITVLPRMESQDIYINVGDTYDIIKNTNIPVSDFNNLYNMATIDDTSVNPPVYSGDYITLDPANGIITGKKIGIGQVRVSYRTGGSSKGIYDTSKIDVSALNEAITYTVHVIDNISISDSTLSNGNSPTFNVFMGSEYPVFANVTNKDYDIFWESADETVATVEENGYGCAIIKGVKPGTVTIRAYQIIDGVEKNAYATVVVKQTITKITIDPSAVELAIDEYKTIVAKFEGDPSDLVWLSSDPTIFAFSEDGNEGTSIIIQGLKPGKALLTAINPDNMICGYCEVTVCQEATGLKLSESSLTLYETTGNHQLYAYITPSDAYDETVTWTSTDPKVVKVDANGLLTVGVAGKATIVVQSVQNPELIAYCNVEVLKSVKGIKFDEENIEIFKGEDYRLAYVVSPEGASNTAVTVTSFNPKVATATASTGGSIIIKAVNTGTTQVMVMTTDGNYYDIVNVTVKQPATGVKMVYTDVTLAVGEFFDLEVTITPNDATEKSLTWESLNTAVASVSSSGRVGGVSEGDAIIAVKTQGGAVAYANVHVYRHATGIVLDPEKVTIDTGETITIDVIFDPEDTTNKEVVWTCSDEEVAVINEAGMVTGLKGGVAVITCRTIDGGLSAFCLIKVEEPIISIKLDPEEYILGIGKKVQINAEISNRDTASDLEVEWYSDDEWVATVDQTGVVTGVEYGECLIYCEAVEGDAVATCKIKVVKEVEKIKLNYSVKTIVVGHQFTLKATVEPPDADFTDVKYVAETEGVVIVDDDGVVTGIKPGNTFVRAEALDNSGKYALCYVTVIDEIGATGITVSDAEIYLEPGENKTITYVIKPSNSTDKVIWSSSDEEVASVSTSGKVTAKRAGDATVTIMTTSGKTAKVTVHVLDLSRKYLELPIYSQYSLIRLFGATEDIFWDVTDISICDVENGVITARKVGTTTVTATYNGRTLSCTVKVTRN